MTAGDEMTLNQTRVGHDYKLVSLDAGEKLRERVSSMGLNSGAMLHVIANAGHGPVEIEVHQTRLGIGRGMSSKIRVMELEPV